MNYIWYFLGYTDDITWDNKQMHCKYKMLNEIKNKVIVLNHIHNYLCKCIDKNIL
jgi:hypothetical protein